jgi:enoyl-CoA hydratase/carnithine racemase
MTPLERERVDAGIEVLRLARPAVRNAMDSALLAALLEALAELAADPALHVLVISTTDVKALCAGADVSEPLTAEQGVARMEAFGRFYAAIEGFPVPTIAVAVGNCVGAGAELVAGVDLRVGGDNLKLAWAGARLGVPVGPARLVPLVGESVAKGLVYTGRVVDQEEAARLGLLHATAPAAEAEVAALALARDLAAKPRDGLVALKQLFREGGGSAQRVAAENAALEAFQRHGGGLPQGTRG